MWTRPSRSSRFNGSDFILTDEQRQRGRDINARAEPLLRDIARVEEKIRHYRQRLLDAQDEKKKIEAKLAPLDAEKSAWWEEVFATKKTRMAVDSITVAVYNASVKVT